MYVIERVSRHKTGSIKAIVSANDTMRKRFSLSYTKVEDYLLS